MLAAFGVDFLFYLIDFQNIVKAVKGFKRTLLLQMKTRKLETLKSERGQQSPQSLFQPIRRDICSTRYLLTTYSTQHLRQRAPRLWTTYTALVCRPLLVHVSLSNGLDGQRSAVHPRFFDKQLGSEVGVVDYVRGSGN